MVASGPVGQPGSRGSRAMTIVTTDVGVFNFGPFRRGEVIDGLAVGLTGTAALSGIFLSASAMGQPANSEAEVEAAPTKFFTNLRVDRGDSLSREMLRLDWEPDDGDYLAVHVADNTFTTAQVSVVRGCGCEGGGGGGGRGEDVPQSAVDRPPQNRPKRRSHADRRVIIPDGPDVVTEVR